MSAPIPVVAHLLSKKPDGPSWATAEPITAGQRASLEAAGIAVEPLGRIATMAGTPERSPNGLHIDSLALSVACAIKDLDPISMPGGHAQHLGAIQSLVADGIRAASGDPGNGR